MESAAPPPEASATSSGAWMLAAASYAALLVAFWQAARHFAVEGRIGGHLLSAFAGFALLLLPYWFFGFGAADALRRLLRRRLARVLAPGLLVIPYFFLSLPRGQFHSAYAAGLAAIPVGLASLFEFFPVAAQAGLTWQDLLVLAAAGLPVEFHWLDRLWPQPGLSFLPKALLLDAALYAFLVVRRAEGVGFDFRPRLRDLGIGAREWALFAPFGIGLGLGLDFIRPHAWLPPPAQVAGAFLVTFIFVAIPEELFFRGLLQNLLEKRLGRMPALLTAAVIFGLSHFNKPAPFNWRYVLLATLAGIFYGRAWMDRRRVLASGITHTLVDVVWTLWFRL
jgi:membrane protease YdiL (CAAX protease family)